jgi:protease-4
MLLAATLLLWLLVVAVGLFLARSAAALVVRALRGRRAVALVCVEGPIGVADGFLAGGVSARRLMQELAAACRDRAAKALLLRVDSTGGAVGATEEVAREIQRFRESGRPVVCSVGNAALSGGFWLALEADTVFAPQGALLGSIGVIVQKPELSGLLDRLGVGREVAKSSEHKDFMSPYRGWDAEERAFLAEVNEEIFLRFVDHVAKRRGLAREAVLAVADGRVFTGERALALGFVDRLGNMEDALARAAAKLPREAPLRTYGVGRWAALWRRT